MTRLIDADELMKYAHDVTLANGARHRCIDATVIYDIPTIDADKALRKAARKLAYIHTQIDLYDDRPELHEEAYWLEYLIDEDWKDGQID